MSTISIIGSGTMATAIGGRVAKAGHTVEVVSRDTAKAQALADKLAARAITGRYGAAPKGDIVILAVPYTGAAATELAKTALGEEGQKAYGTMTPLQRMGDPTEIASAAAFLASSDSSFMTASEVAVDGGLAQL